MRDFPSCATRTPISAARATNTSLSPAVPFSPSPPPSPVTASAELSVAKRLRELPPAPLARRSLEVKSAKGLSEVMEEAAGKPKDTREEKDGLRSKLDDAVKVARRGNSKHAVRKR